MTTWKKVSLALAIMTAGFLSGIGIFIAEQNLAGILLCLVGSILVPGMGFMLKKRLTKI